MSFLNVLPDALCLMILGEWCDLEILARVDSALCNTNTRKMFFYLIPQAKFKIRCMCKRNFFEWIAIRDIQLVSAYVGAHNLDLMITKVITHRIKELSCSSEITDVHLYQTVIEKCPKLTSPAMCCQSNSFCDGVLLSLSSECLTKLTSIILMSNFSLSMLLQNCFKTAKILLALKHQLMVHLYRKTR